MTFEKHRRSVFSAAAQRIGIMRKSWQVFHDRPLILRSFWSFVQPVLEYCSAVWCSAADSHLKLPDRVVRSAGFLAGVVLDCNIVHRRSVAELCMLFKIKIYPMHPVSGALPLPRRVLLVVLWLLIGTRSRLLVVGLLNIAEPLCSSRCPFGTILVTLCLMVCNWRVISTLMSVEVSRALKWGRRGLSGVDVGGVEVSQTLRWGHRGLSGGEVMASRSLRR